MRESILTLASPINFVVGLIELLSNLGRIISFSFRLFGNIFAGEVMIIVAGFFVAYLLPVPLMAIRGLRGLHTGSGVRDADPVLHQARYHGTAWG